jgi:hypothetical protein
MKKWFKNNILYIIETTVGAQAGYPDSYRDWLQVGCASGTCIITSKPVNSTLYGALMGVLFFGFLKMKTKRKF